MFINSKIKNNIADAGFNYYVKNHVSSTNNYLDYGYIRDKAPIVILSNNQRNPRGRRGNKWVDQQNVCPPKDTKTCDLQHCPIFIGLSDHFTSKHK